LNFSNVDSEFEGSTATQSVDFAFNEVFLNFGGIFGVKLTGMFVNDHSDRIELLVERSVMVVVQEGIVHWTQSSSALELWADSADVAPCDLLTGTTDEAVSFGCFAVKSDPLWIESINCAFAGVIFRAKWALGPCVVGIRKPVPPV
jgi:hypothetical protein